MMNVLYFCVWISGLIGQGQASCEFTPNVSKTCLDFWTFTDMTYGCLNVKDNMEFSGLRKIVDGEHFISVNTTDMTTGNIITVWVRKADGHCTMNCCDRKTNQRRFLLDQWIQNECERKCHGHAGSCSLVVVTVSCHCNGGYSGHHCEKEEPCHNVECQHGGNCSSGLCSCVNGFTGQHCEIKDPCHNVECQNGGQCSSGLCSCVNGFTGQHCEIKDPCHDVTCLNDGLCISGLCGCVNGFIGRRCEMNDTCAGITCKNGGSCNDGHCSCTTGYSGDQCQNYDPCHNVSCMKGGYCVNAVCYCLNNNQWLPCEHCLPNQCSGHGKCINLRTGFSCTCDTGYTGITCNTVVDYCNPDPCNRNGHCTNSPSGFSCFCQNGYTGSTCNKVIDYCHPDPCSGQGTCLNSLSGYTCHCNKGYTGKQCNTVANHCLPDPCKGHGSCYDGKQGYFCNCHAGYTGQNCERSVMHCSPDPCNGNGICHNTQTGFTCSCHQGYTGQTCAAPVSHCSPDPCNGRGACYNGKTDYYCQCQIGYTGRNCQTVSTTPAATTHISGLGSMPMLPSGLQQTVKEHHCNKLGLLMDLAVGKALHQQGAKGCGGNSSDAVLIKHCQAPSFSGWRRGLQVINHCNQLNPYTPVGEWDSVRFTNNIGVMTSCQSGVIEMISQSCGSQLNLHNITSPAFNSVYTIDWT